MSCDSEVGRAFFSTRGRQRITATPLKIVSHPIKGDIVRVSIHAAGGGIEWKAAFDTIFDLTHLIVRALHLGALHNIFTHALALLQTLPLQPGFSFLQSNRSHVNKISGTE